ncbi:unnamed protein product, partial [Symbiodinium natans]
IDPQFENPVTEAVINVFNAPSILRAFLQAKPARLVCAPCKREFDQMEIWSLDGALLKKTGWKMVDEYWKEHNLPDEGQFKSRLGDRAENWRGDEARFRRFAMVTVQSLQQSGFIDEHHLAEPCSSASTLASASASPDLPDDFGELLHALERGEVEQAARTEKSAAASDDAAGTLARLREMCSKITKNSSVHVECGIGMPFWATVVVRVHSWHAEFNGLDTTWSAACEMGADAAAQCIDAVPPCVWRCYEPTLEQPSEALSKSESNPVETRQQQPSEASTSAPTPVENRAEVVAEAGRQAKDYKSKLGEIVMRRTRKAITENVLRYVVTEPTGPGNGFRCEVVVRLDEGTGSEQSFSGKNCSSKKEAMQAAAEQACQHLESVATHRPQQPAEASTSAPTPVENRAEVVAEPARQAKDYKSKLGEIVMQRTRKAITENVLRYVVTEPTGAGNGFRCKVVVRLDERTGSEQSFSGKNCSSKKEAMQAAAEQACQHLESVATHRPQQPAEASTSAPTPVENRAEVVAEPARQAKDYKSKLGEIVMQRTRKAINENVLRYVVTEPTGPGNGFRCTVVVRLDEGTGSEQSFSGKNCSSKKEAMQAAAEQACQHLESVATHRPQQPAEASTS